MMAAAASLLVKSNVGAFLFRSSPRRRRICMHGDWLAGFLVRPRLAVPTCRLRAFARACGVARDRTTHCCTGHRIVSRWACAGLTDQSAR